MGGIQQKNILILARPVISRALVKYLELFRTQTEMESVFVIEEGSSVKQPSLLSFLSWKGKNNNQGLCYRLAPAVKTRKFEKNIFAELFNKNLHFLFSLPFFDEIYIDEGFPDGFELGGWIIAFLNFYELGSLDLKINS